MFAYKKIVFGIVVTLIIIVVGLLSNDELKHRESLNGPDVWEYQTVAVNFSEYNRFPVMGYLGQEDQYQLNTLKKNFVEEYVHCRFLKHGPVTYLAKPPFYTVTLGLVYKLFQPEIIYGYYLNVIFFAGILLVLFFLGYYIDSSVGSLLGIVSSIIYVLFGSHGLSDILPATLLTFISCSIALVCVLMFKSLSAKHFVTMGVLMAIGLLTKGNIIFIVFLIPIYVFYLFRNSQKVILKLILMFAVMAIVILPWSIYANYVRLNCVDEWTAWQQIIINAESDCLLDSSKSSDWARAGININYNEQIKIVSHIYSRFTAGDDLIILSNQLTSDELLSVHNEYMSDGYWRPAWRFRDNAIYNNNYLEQSPYVKILSFYKDNPSSLFKIAIGKMMRTISSKFSFFLLSAFLFGCFIWLSKINSEKMGFKILFLVVSVSVFFLSLFYNIQFHLIYATLFFFTGLTIYRKNEMEIVPFIFPVCIINSYLIVFIFYGASRFINIIEPLTIFSSLYFLYLFGRNLLQKKYVVE